MNIKYNGILVKTVTMSVVLVSVSLTVSSDAKPETKGAGVKKSSKLNDRKARIEKVDESAMSLESRQLWNKSKDALLKEVVLLSKDQPTVKVAIRYQQVAMASDFHYSDRELAEKLYLKALEIFDKQIGTDSPQTLPILSRLGELSRDNDVADAYYTRALTSAESMYGKNDQHVAQILAALGKIQTEKKHYKEAEVLQKRVMQIYDKDVEASSLNSATARDVLARTYIAEGDPTHALDAITKSIEEYTKMMGPKSILIASLYDTKAQLYLKQKEFAQCQACLEKSLQIKREALGPKSEFLITTLDLYADLMTATGKSEKASELTAQANSLRALFPDTSHTPVI